MAKTRRPSIDSSAAWTGAGTPSAVTKIVVAASTTVDGLCDQMTERFLADGGPIRAGVCLADPATLPFTLGLEQRLRDADVEVEMVRYRVGPSIAAHTGPGTAGGFWYAT